MEMGARWSNYVTMVSADDKCKLNIGVNPAVDRRVKASRTYLVGQQALIPDHDKRTSSTITPRGYMILQAKSHNLETETMSAASEAENSLITDPDTVYMEIQGEEKQDDTEEEDPEENEEAAAEGSVRYEENIVVSSEEDVENPEDELEEVQVYETEIEREENEDEPEEIQIPDTVEGSGRDEENSVLSSEEDVEYHEDTLSSENEDSDGIEKKKKIRTGKISKRAIESSSDEESVVETSQKLFTNFPMETSNLTKDEVGRIHFSCPRSGPGHMFLASSQLSPSTAQEHVNDMRNIFEANPSYRKPILVVITDDGKLNSTNNFLSR